MFYESGSALSYMKDKLTVPDEGLGLRGLGLAVAGLGFRVGGLVFVSLWPRIATTHLSFTARSLP